MKWPKYTEMEDYQKESKKKTCKKYEKTKKGFLVRLYRNMKSRVVGVQAQKHYLYEGKELLSKDMFYEWALSNEKFHDLFNEYENSGYARKLAPSVDRINSSLGYTIDNIRFVTHALNSASHSRCRKIILNGKIFLTIREAERENPHLPRFQYYLKNPDKVVNLKESGVNELRYLDDDECAHGHDKCTEWIIRDKKRASE